MPTYNRRRFVPQAIRYFLRQDYPERELIVVDDGTDPVGDLVPSDPRIRYVPLPERRTIGAKRNIGCEHARGKFIVQWDDDDWMADRRLRHQVAELLTRDVDVVGLSTVLYLDPFTGRSWRYEYPAERRLWVFDPTFCFRRELGRAAPFPDQNFGLCSRYFAHVPGISIGRLEDPSWYVGIVHPGNTSPKTPNAWWHPYPFEEVRALLGSDWHFYEQTGAAGDGAAADAVALGRRIGRSSAERSDSCLHE
jgi:glycosyltransferase involved in cell wall biosynthesis